MLYTIKTFTDENNSKYLGFQYALDVGNAINTVKTNKPKTYVKKPSVTLPHRNITLYPVLNQKNAICMFPDKEEESLDYLFSIYTPVAIPGDTSLLAQLSHIYFENNLPSDGLDILCKIEDVVETIANNPHNNLVAIPWDDNYRSMRNRVYFLDRANGYLKYALLEIDKNDGVYKISLDKLAPSTHTVCSVLDGEMSLKRDEVSDNAKIDIFATSYWLVVKDGDYLEGLKIITEPGGCFSNLNYKSEPICGVREE